MRVNKSAARALEILDLIAAKQEPLTITEVGQALDIPKSSAFELLHTLVEKSYLEFADKRLKTFRLGIKAFKTGLSFLAKTDIHREARPFLEELMAKSRETVFLAIEHDGKLVYLDKVEGNASVRTSAVLGSTNPMHSTGLGKALLATYDNRRVEEIVKKEGMVAKTEFSITDFQALIRELDVIRKRGCSIDNRESELEVFCVAAPIRDMSGKAVAAISIASLAVTMLSDPDRVEYFKELLTNAASDISSRLGYTGKTLYPQQA